MILVQIATALAIGAYVVLSRDAQPKRPDATPRKSIQHPADHLIDRDGHPALSAIQLLVYPAAAARQTVPLRSRTGHYFHVVALARLSILCGRSSGPTRE
jgi:hypothetical protein